MYKTSSHTYRLWGTTNIRSVEEHTLYKIILGIIPHRRPKARSRDSEKISRRENRWAISWIVFLYSIYECKRQLQQMGYNGHIRQTKR